MKITNSSCASKIGNASEKLVNEIRKITYFVCIEQRKLRKKYIALKYFIKFTGKHLRRSLFFKESCRPQRSGLELYFKNRIQRRYFPVIFEKCLRTNFFRAPPGNFFWVFKLFDKSSPSFLRLVQLTRKILFTIRKMYNIIFSGL